MLDSARPAPDADLAFPCASPPSMKIVISSDEKQPNHRYRGALLCSGALPEEVEVVVPGDALPETFDGLLVAGGADVDPARYGEETSAPGVEVVAERDALDLDLLGRARDGGAPVFGICRGLQIVNVALGGTLWQDLPTQRDRGVPHAFGREDGWPPDHPAHVVRPAPGSAGGRIGDLLRRAGELTVNSRHHQAVKDLAPGLVPVAASPDDLVEAFVGERGPFLAAVQWHPEDLVAEPVQKALFVRFVEAARRAEAARGRLPAPLLEVVLEGAIPVIRFRRPGRRNALTASVLRLLAETVEALEKDATAPAIVLTGADGDFASGPDLDVLAAQVEARDEEGFRETLEAGKRAVLAIVGSGKPVVAALDGLCAGTALGLALACDVRVASRAARLAPHTAWGGLSPGDGTSALLPALAGPGAALDLVLSADEVPASRARELGLVDGVVDDGSPLTAALARAVRWSERPGATRAATKRAVASGRMSSVAQALDREIQDQLDLFRSGALAQRRARRPRLEPEEIA